MHVSLPYILVDSALRSHDLLSSLEPSLWYMYVYADRKLCRWLNPIVCSLHAVENFPCPLTGSRKGPNLAPRLWLLRLAVAVFRPALGSGSHQETIAQGSLLT